MDGSEKEESSDMRTSPRPPKELDRGGETSNVIPSLPSPPVADQVKDVSNLLSLTSDTPHSSDEGQVSQPDLFTTDLARGGPSESSLSHRTEGLTDDGGPDGMQTGNMETPAWLCEELDRGVGNSEVFPPLNSPPVLDLKGTSTGSPDEVNSGDETTNVVLHLTSPPAPGRKNDDPVADCQFATSDAQKRGGHEQLSQSSLSTIDHATTSFSKRSSSLMSCSLSFTELAHNFGHEAKSEINPETEACGRIPGDGMQDHAFATDPDARCELLKRRRRTAIEKKDCKALLQIVEEAHTQFRERLHDILGISSEQDPRTILHVAAMQGCFPLAKQVLDTVSDFFEEAGETETEEDEDKRPKLYRVAESYIGRVDPESNLTAFQMVFDITGNRSIAEYINRYARTLSYPRMFEQSHPFYEAHTHSEWWSHLRRYCGGLRCDVGRELRYNSRWLLETWHGLTVLHLAILLDDLRVVREIMNVFGTQNEVVWPADIYYPSTLTWDEMLMLPGSGWVDTLQNDHLLPSYDESRVRNLLKSISRSTSVLQYGKTALELAKKLGNSDILKALEDYGTPEPTNSHPIKVVTKLLPEFDNWHMAVMTSIEAIPQCEDEIDWRIGYEEDVDFNFEKGNRLCLLQLHYFCKHPLRFQNKIEVWWKGHKGHKVYDGQGRSMFCILLDSWSDQNSLPKFFTKIFDTQWIIVDMKGRYFRDLLFLKDPRTIVERHWRHIPYPILLYKFQQALHMKQSKLAINMWLAGLKRYGHAQIMIQLYGQKQVTISHPLLIAASYGNQAVLRVILDGTSDPMITDDKQRTSLHHAADASLLDAPYTDGKFYSSVENLCQDRKMWKDEREKIRGFQEVNSANDVSISRIEEISNVERKACILMLVQAGVDLSEVDNEGKVPNIGACIDATLQSWWYDMVVKETTDIKNSFNQAGSALSVVGALVAATSYVGPLQPPMSYIEGGFVHIGEKLIEIFMVTNTLAFYFAMASVMFAVVPSLRMPRGVTSELKRARHMVLLSLCLLLIATSMIIISFASASIAIIHDEHSFHQSNLLFIPSIIGWSICLISSLGFLLRVTTLMHYKNSTIRMIYQFSPTQFCKKAGRSWKYYFKRLSIHGDYEVFLENVYDLKYIFDCESGFTREFIKFIKSAILGAIWLVFWPIVHYIYTYRNLERLERAYKDRKAKLHANKMQRSMLF